MSESDAVESLQRLGLSQYGAAVFVALQRLGSGTAREVADVTDVPRSQVYGAAERLEERGLVEILRASPIRYRPVSLEEARTRLRERFEREEERAFEALHAVHREAATDGEQEAVWTVEGHGAVLGRIEALVADATERVVYAADPAYVEDRIVSALADAAAEGVTVVVASAGDIDDRFGGTDVGTRSVALPDAVTRAEEGERLLVVDDDAVLVSVTSDGEETAIWSAGTGFAAVLTRLADTRFGDRLDLGRG